MNPRAAINDLHPFQGCPFSLLGPSPNSLNLNRDIKLLCHKEPTRLRRSSGLLPLSRVPPHDIYGEDGIRTHAPLRTNGFQDRLVMTTSIPLHSHALNQRKNYISKIKIISQQKIVPEDKNFSAISKSSDVVIFMFEYEPSVMCTVTFE